MDILAGPPEPRFHFDDSFVTHSLSDGQFSGVCSLTSLALRFQP